MRVYELKEAIEKAKKTGSAIKRKHWQYPMTFDDVHFYDAEGKVFYVSPADMSADDWQIIPAKKEMVSTEDLVKQFKPDNNEKFYGHQMISIAEASAKNRDILYADLMKLMDFYTLDIPADGIRKEVNRIKDVLAPTSSTG